MTTWSCLQDELISAILSRTDFRTRLTANQVSRKWNNVLLNPLSTRIWQDSPAVHFENSQRCGGNRDRKLKSRADWISNRAATLGQLRILCKKFTNEADPKMPTDAQLFAEQHFPYLLGRLYQQGLRLEMSCLFGKKLLPHVS